MRLSSTAFTDGDTIPERFANTGVTGGRNASPPLEWGEEPAGTRSFALAVIDHHPVAHGWVHWLVADVPAAIHSLPEGASRASTMPSAAVELPTTYGRPGYGGPQPPAGSGMHDYVTTVFAVDVEHLDVARDSAWEAVRDAMRGHVLDSASLTGFFGR
jgi:Raf kinase inhibitor-like YbhB/YbcL family protein